MPYQKIFHIDRAGGVLDAQLLSSQTSGTFTFSTLSNLGSQTFNMPSGEKAVLTIEDEQILCSLLSVSAGTATATIETRGYNSTAAATHASSTGVELHLVQGTLDDLGDHMVAASKGYIVQASVTSITDANTHTIAGDQTAIFTVGRVYLFKVSGTWYRSVIRSSTYGASTTIELTGDGLIASGTVTDAGFEFVQSVNKSVDYQLIKAATNVPADSPPSGYVWLFAKSGLKTKDANGAIKFLAWEVAAVTDSATPTIDWSLGNHQYLTLTQNITALTHSGGVDGEKYVLRLKQHASSAKTVVLGTSGGTRFSNDIASYTMTTDVGATDVLEFVYNGTDSKYDLVRVTKGFQASPVQSSSGGFLTGTSGEAITAGLAVYLKASDSKLYRTSTSGDESTFSYVGVAKNTTSGADQSQDYWVVGSTSNDQSGMTVGSAYFLNGTTGQITSTPDSTRSARIGIALSATKLKLTDPKFIRTGTNTITGTGNTTVTCGFYPLRIDLHAGMVSPGAAYESISIGDDGNKCVMIATPATNRQSYENTKAWYLYKNGTGIWNNGTIDTKTQTGFNLNCATRNGDAELHWTAYSY